MTSFRFSQTVFMKKVIDTFSGQLSIPCSYGAMTLERKGSLDAKAFNWKFIWIDDRASGHSLRMTQHRGRDNHKSK